MSDPARKYRVNRRHQLQRMSFQGRYETAKRAERYETSTRLFSRKRTAVLGYVHAWWHRL